MDETSATPARSLFEDLRELRGARATGALEIEVGDRRRRVFLRDGELYLPGSHPVARLLDAAAGGADRPAGADRLKVLERMAHLLADWSGAPRRFSAGVAALPADLVGPLPTSRLIMLGVTASLSTREIERTRLKIGSRFVADVPVDRLGLSALLPTEQYVLERLRVPMSFDELLAASPVTRDELERALVQLAAAGAVRAEADATPVEAELAGIVTRLDGRIASSLDDRPLELSPEQYRTRIQDCLASYGGLDYYELLGVPANAGEERIQAAYEDFARLVHPANARRFGAAGAETPLRALFERATRAYATLMEPERRRAYNERQLIDLPTAKPTGARREAELRAIARAQFERALAYAGAHDFHNAVQLLEQAVKSDPQPEYWATLASCQARNPSWRPRAIESYRQAIQLDPENADVRYALGRLYEECGEPDRARAQYAAAVRANRDHLEAADRLARLVGEQRAARRAGAGWLRRLLRKF